jgi:hypothetical protein
MRLLSPDDACVQVEVERHGPLYKGRTVDVSDPSHIRALLNAGYTAASVAGPPAKAKGYNCTKCGFRSFFRRCGRCGHTPE